MYVLSISSLSEVEMVQKEQNQSITVDDDRQAYNRAVELVAYLDHVEMFRSLRGHALSLQSGLKLFVI